MRCDMDKWDQALQKAISLAGNQAKLAKILNIGRSNISHWKKGLAVPAIHALEIERLFGIDAQLFNRVRQKVASPPDKTQNGHQRRGKRNGRYQVQSPSGAV